MTAPPPPAPPTGQPTLIAIEQFLQGLVNTVIQEAPAVGAAIEAGIDALGNVISILNPAAGREVEREQELAAMFAAKDIQGLLAYDADVPAHPNKSRLICRNYLKMLGYDTSKLPPLP